MRACYDILKGFLLQWGFQPSRSDTSLFFKHIGKNIIVILIYVDDILVIGSSNVQIEGVIDSLGREFTLKDLGDFNYFLYLEVTPSGDGFHLCQTKYIGDILKKTYMLKSKGWKTPINVSVKFQKNQGIIFENLSLYRSIVRSLQYVTLTCPDIAFTINKLSQFLAASTTQHWQACKRVMIYLQNTAHYGLQFRNLGSFTLTTYSDGDWDSNPDDQKPIGGYCVYLGNNLVSWSSKKQNIISRSTTKSEYRALLLGTFKVL